jgi:hypothetical protein
MFFDHFKQHDTPGSIFMCYAPTYAGGYERFYKRLEQVFECNRVTYSMLDDDARDRLLAWMRARKYVWCDDSRIYYVRAASRSAADHPCKGHVVIKMKELSTNLLVIPASFKKHLADARTLKVKSKIEAYPFRPESTTPRIR